MKHNVYYEFKNCSICVVQKFIYVHILWMYTYEHLSTKPISMAPAMKMAEHASKR